MPTPTTENVLRPATPRTTEPGTYARGDEQTTALRRWYFAFFVVSGACSLVYEVVWLRLASADFGITTPMVSIVLSVFMAGLGLGSWLGGRLARRWKASSAARTLRRYAALELLIGLSGVLVVPMLSWGRLVSERIQDAANLGSLGLYAVAGALVTVALLPWCTCMGATIPFMMSAMKKSLGGEAGRSFSFLYVANVLGAVLGTLVPAFILFELFGFERTLLGTALTNGILAISVAALSLGKRVQEARMTLEAGPTGPVRSQADLGSKSLLLWLLFLTGFASMALEVIWIRQFTPYLGTFVYAFALILAIYLVATFLGARSYRAWNRSRSPLRGVGAWAIVGSCALIPLVTANPRMRLQMVSLLPFLSGIPRVLLGVAPFSGVVGFITPMLVDDWGAGDPARGGKAYGVNVLGCILGPLFAAFCLLPWLGVEGGTMLLAAALLAAGLLATLGPHRLGVRGKRSIRGLLLWGGAATLVLVATSRAQAYQDIYRHRAVKRDYVATVIATGTGMRKKLLVNGIGITHLTPLTKMMAHLPLAFLSRRPRNGLVICFGMGTTFRSMLSWRIPTTGVDLVPSVPKLFGYYFSDASELMKSPLAHVVIDDGRRFLERTKGRYDVIVIDPPPPVQAAGSSLLYSRQFYAIAKKRLRPGGILAQWLPSGDAATQASVAKAISESFPYVRVFGSIEGWGYHFLASEQPIPDTPASQLAAKMPPAAVADMLEWGPYHTAQQQIQAFLSREIPISSLIAKNPSVPALSDNRPVNEYFLLRDVLPHSWMGGMP